MYKFKMWLKKFNPDTGKDIAPRVIKVSQEAVKEFCININSLGFKVVELEVPKGGIYTEKELTELMGNKPVPKTDLELQLEAQQKEIDELKNLIKGGSKDEKPKIDESLIKEYKAIFERKPHHTWDEATIKEKIAKHNEENE